MNDSFSTEVRKALRETRLGVGLTQKALAIKANVHPASISSWERGKRDLTLGRFGAVLAAMGYRASILIGVPREGEPKSIFPKEVQNDD